MAPVAPRWILAVRKTGPSPTFNWHGCLSICERRIGFQPVNALKTVAETIMADDELLDQDIDQELEPTPFISKSLIGRFLAVGVFVALGTFAVIQSVTPKHDEAAQHLDHEHPGVISSVSADCNDSRGFNFKVSALSLA